MTKSGGKIAAAAEKPLCYHFSTLDRAVPLAKQIAKAATSSKAQNSLRIIGGQWRGRKLSFPSLDGLRPTGDRIRETLFNWLAPDIQGARCLDVFAGSGALGLEALSRGAAHSLLLERNPSAAAQMRANLEVLKAERGQVVNGDSLAFLAHGNLHQPYDIVFIDPPFQLNLWQQVIDGLEAGNFLAEDAVIYLETGPKAHFNTPSHWTLHRDKCAGQVSYRLYYRNESSG
jgi:16S rRNA (guanine966-N2)-methyltransferase